MPFIRHTKSTRKLSRSASKPDSCPFVQKISKRLAVEAARLTNMQHLQEVLSLGSNKAAVECLSACTHLTTLRLGASRLDGEAVAAVSRLTGLVELHLVAIMSSTAGDRFTGSVSFFRLICRFNIVPAYKQPAMKGQDVT